MLDFIGSLVSSGLNAWGQSENRAAQERINAQNLAWAKEQFAQQTALQKEFAQSGIQWKVADAAKAGVHPLVGLGAQTSSFSPISVGGEAKAPEWDMSSVGQDLSRAFKAASDERDRQLTDEREARKLQLEKGALENDILKTELVSRVNKERAGGQLGPPMPVGGRVPLPRPGPLRSVGGYAASEDDLKQKPEDFPATAVNRPFGYPVLSNPYFGDAQSHEDRYGENELASMLKWGVNQAADHLYTGYKFFGWGRPDTNFTYRRPTHRDDWVRNSNRR